ncbi:triose-phosphate isomerase [Patescibacteria group bacterium]
MKPLIVANWKCNPQTTKEAKRLFNLVKGGMNKNVKVVICPPFIFLLKLEVKNSGLELGGQDCFWEKGGAFTGEISAGQLLDLGLKYVILGHSERRIHFNETDEMINKKIKATISSKLNPILCVGESERERKGGKTFNVLKSQIEKGLKGISKKEIKNLIVAYEPIWAIGTGRPCNIAEAQKTRLIIRKILSRLFGSFLAEKISIIYGGSVHSKNARSYIKEAGFDGLLPGGASLKAKEFIKIIKSVS